MGIESVLKIGVATRDLDESYRLFTQVLGLSPGPKGPYEPAGMKVGLCHLSDVTFELMEPMRPDAPVARFIGGHGEGLEHVCFRVSNIEKVVDALKAQGIQFALESPVQVEFLSRPAKAIFARRQSFCGVLVQFVELY
jgi:methylmalonyl-CoA/ethylmalonyl-CoA epimerase